MKHTKNKRYEHPRQKPKAVDEIADYLTCGVVFVLLCATISVCFWLFFLSQLGLEEIFKEFGEFTCATIFLVVFSIFLIVLLRDFRNLQRWTYGYIEFLCAWSSFSPVIGLDKKLQQKDVRRAFGLDDTPDSLKEE